MSIELIQASAHHLPMISDESVHVICCSPPYFSLRAYSGDQSIEWPTVEYAPMPGLPPLRIQGCESGCQHEWGNPLLQREQSGRHRLEWETGGNPAAKVESGPVAQGAYCIHCSGWRGPLGLEPDISMYIAHLILCLREWKRILRTDGTCWVNLSDTYSGSGRGGNPEDSPHFGKIASNVHSKDLNSRNQGTGLPAKNLCLIPSRFALAAQADGWWIRADMIWAKKNCMPESCTDRPTKAHEYIFLLAKSQSYYYDADAVREPHAEPWRGDGTTIESNPKGLQKNGDDLTYGRPGLTRASQAVPRAYNPSGRNLRTVLHLATSPTPYAHFATFPERIPEIAILAGTSAYGCCPKCKAGYVRLTKKTTHFEGGSGKAGRSAEDANANGKWAGQQYGTNIKLGPVVDVETLGWQPACECNAGEPIPATVFDPFHGSGTTGKVALRLGRSYIGVDLAESYLSDITAQRLGDGVQMEIAW